MTLTPSRQWVGAPVTLHSSSFAGLATEDILVTTPTSAIDGPAQMLVATRRIDAETLAFDAWGYSESRTVSVEVPGFLPAEATYTAVGQVTPTSGWDFDPLRAEFLDGWTPIDETGRVLVSGDFYEGTHAMRGYALVNLRDRSFTAVPGLSVPYLAGGDPTVAKLLSPGASTFSDHLLIDFSSWDSMTPVQVWQVGYGLSLSPLYELPCTVPPNTESYAWGYAAAELADTVCVTLAPDGTLLRNGVEVGWRDSAMGTFRYQQHPRLAVAPGGTWVTVLGSTGARGDLHSWPVLRADGSIAYTLDRFAQVRDADFSATGDTLFVLARGPDLGSGRDTWIEGIESASGATLGRVALDRLDLTDDAEAVLADPARPWLYVLGRRYFAVADRRAWTLVTRMPTGCYPAYYTASALVLDGDLVHAIVEWHYGTGVCHFDTL